MLLNSGRRKYEHSSARDSVHNYYEQVVIEQILRSNTRATEDPEFLADVACVALNHLPPRYVRHDVDMTFFLSPQDMDEMVDRVVAAVNSAVRYVQSRDISLTEDDSEIDGFTDAQETDVHKTDNTLLDPNNQIDTDDTNG